MLAALIAVEGVVLCFILLLVCVIGIANGPVGLVIFYEKDVQERVVELGLTTKEKIGRTKVIALTALLLPCIVLVPLMVYGLNGAVGFLEGFLQMAALLLVMGLFDRLFIDTYWVGHTKAWLIPGIEDLMPLVPTKTLIKKWVTTIIGYPIFAAIIAGIMTLFIK